MVDFILSGLASVALFLLGRWSMRRDIMREYREVMPISWNCPNEGCMAHLDTNDPMVADELIRQHQMECRHA